jgi:hypothetical protein
MEEAEEELEEINKKVKKELKDAKIKIEFMDCDFEVKNVSLLEEGEWGADLSVGFFIKADSFPSFLEILRKMNQTSSMLPVGYNAVWKMEIAFKEVKKEEEGYEEFDIE